MAIARRPFAELSDVSWSSLRSASGTAEHVPDALARLAAARGGAELFDAYWQLDNHIVLQGTIYESAYEAIPFVIDALISTEAWDVRNAAYDLLIEIAAGVSEPADLAHACRERIRSAREYFVADLLGPAREPRRSALDLLFALREDPAELAPLLRGVDAGDDDELRGELSAALAELEEREVAH